ncbi:MAG TPA: GIY-YIG nuclease family protein [Cyclobacteriaceae bacterium]|nr:GIY-YIG nuclease family protein [Cyclobacteriaceae bacterium]HRJ80518.1 GIY-YIG nuclease family protein [Cyclobacteriaceae bacterium]
MPYFVYILKSQLNQSFYKGHTDDLVRRIAEHNSGKVTYSKKFRPWNLVWLTTKPNKKEAYELEPRPAHYGSNLTWLRQSGC